MILQAILVEMQIYSKTYNGATFAYQDRMLLSVGIHEPHPLTDCVVYRDDLPYCVVFHKCRGLLYNVMLNSNATAKIDAHFCFD